MSGKSLRCKSRARFSGSFEGWQQRFLKDLVNIIGSRHHLLFGQHMQLTQCSEAHKAPDLDFQWMLDCEGGGNFLFVTSPDSIVLTIWQVEQLKRGLI